MPTDDSEHSEHSRWLQSLRSVGDSSQSSFLSNVSSLSADYDGNVDETPIGSPNLSEVSGSSINTDSGNGPPGSPPLEFTPVSSGSEYSNDRDEVNSVISVTYSIENGNNSNGVDLSRVIHIPIQRYVINDSKSDDEISSEINSSTVSTGNDLSRSGIFSDSDLSNLSAVNSSAASVDSAHQDLSANSGQANLSPAAGEGKLCTLCTYHNRPNSVQCFMCHVVLDVLDKQSVRRIEEEDPNFGKIECGSCTFVNRKTAVHCEMCGGGLLYKYSKESFALSA